MRAVVDTNILVSAGRSGSGASNQILRFASERRFLMLVSVPLFLEYEAVLTRPEHLLSTGLDRALVEQALNFIGEFVEPVRLEFRWRPQLADPADEMVLEAAINGRADCIVTFNERHFLAAARFGISVVSPREFLEQMR